MPRDARALLLENLTARIVGLSNKKNVAKHEKYCLYWEVLRDVYEAGEKAGYQLCGDRVIKELRK